MIEPDRRKAIHLLHEGGMGMREIARRIGVSRNIVRDIIREEGAVRALGRKDKIPIDEELLKRLYEECDGWKHRIHEKLVDEEKVEVSYPTLTRRLRELGLGRQEKARCARVPDEPGQEMQHDTAIYTLQLGGKPQKVIASLLYLRYSKRRYLKFYSTFNRFRMKCFFHEALTFWGYAAAECIIDNTNLARLRGTGEDAVIVPEMESFSKPYRFKFRCHAIGHPNRKAGEERSFWTIETNFFPGRKFLSFEDLNEQGHEWATVRMYHRPVSKTGLIPAKAFESEQAYLKKVVEHLPAPYLVHERGTDQYGYVAFGSNFYWVPGVRRDKIRVLEYADHLKLYRARELLAEYRLPAQGVANRCFSPEGLPQPPHQPKHRKRPTLEEEKRLRALGEVVNAYLDFALKPKGNERHRLVRDLYRLTQQMTPALFVETLKRALKYRIGDLETLRRIALLEMNEGVEVLPYAEVDESFKGRDSYIEGHLSDAPDFSLYDKLLENQSDG